MCPICFEQTGALTDGARMGAAVLALAVVAILAAVGRFGWRVMRGGAGD